MKRSVRILAAAFALLTLSALLSAQKPPKPGGSATNPAIAYETRTRNGDWDLMVMDADGTDQTRLVTGGDNSTPGWSPDGEWIAFARTRVSNPGIYMIRRNGTGLCRVAATNGLLVLGSPTWSPRVLANGRYKIIYADTAADGGITDLFAVDAACGSEPQKISTTLTPGGFGPAWSKDDLLAFGRGLAGLYVHEIFIDGTGMITLGPGVNLTGSGPLAGHSIWSATWTDEGTALIVPAAAPQSLSDLWVVSGVTPGLAAQLTDTPDQFESRVSWSPDFTRAVFDESLGGVESATLALLDGVWTMGTPVTLASAKRTSPGVARPSWRPVP